MEKKKKKDGVNERPAVTRQRKLISDANVPTYYSNTVEIGSTGADFRIRIGEILEATPEELLVRHRATIYFSPRHAKEISLKLDMQIKAYEEKYGEITPTE